jgi:hypothetical protein
MSAIPVDQSGQYSVSVPAESVVWLQAGQGFQPCAAVASGASPAPTVHIVEDPGLLGGNLPQMLLAEGRLVGGVVYGVNGGVRQPLPDVDVILDGLRAGVVTASTRTGTDGRYVFCNVPEDPARAAEAWQPGYTPVSALLNGRSTIDIELGR